MSIARYIEPRQYVFKKSIGEKGGTRIEDGEMQKTRTTELLSIPNIPYDILYFSL